MSKPLTLRVLLNGPVPAYRQICDQLRALCVEGALKPGDKLPGVRGLAAQLGVHFNTIAEAYRTLAEEGWLEVQQGRGAVILDRELPKAPRATAEYSSRLRHLVAELRSLGLEPQWIKSQVEAALEKSR